MAATDAALLKNNNQLIPQNYNAGSDAYESNNGDDNAPFVLMNRNVLSAATIANAASLSGEIDLGAYRLFGLDINGWTTAVITFQVATATGGTFRDLYDDNGWEVQVASFSGARSISLDACAAALAPWRFIKIRSGTTGTAVNQGAERTITPVVKG